MSLERELLMMMSCWGNFEVGEVGRLFERERDVFQSRERIEKRVALEKKTTATLKVCTGCVIVGAERATVEFDASRIRLQDVG